VSILTCKVDNQGRIMLPAKWRKERGIQAEGELLVELRDNCLVLRTREQAVRDAQSMVRRLIRPGKSLVDDLLEQRRSEALQEPGASGRRLGKNAESPEKRSGKPSRAHRKADRHARPR
jgi:AbrB family looped-hinge helix DNA binding protein